MRTLILSKKERKRRAIKSWKTRRRNGNVKPPWSKGLTAESSSKVKAATRKMSRTLKRRYRSGEIVNHNKGKRFSRSYRDALSIAHMGQYCSSRTRAKMSKTRKGRVHSKAHCEAISRSLMGHPVSLERRKHLSEVLTGRKNPAQTKFMKSRKGRRIAAQNLLPAREKARLHPNGLESLMAKILRSLHLKYKFQQRIENRYEADFLIKGTNLLIEADGEYWHRDKKKQKARDLYLRRHGYRIRHFSERDIHRHSEVVAVAIRNAMA